MTNTWRIMYDLADQLYMTLSVEGDKIVGKGNNIRVQFGRLEMPVKPSIVGSHRHEGVIGVEVHVAGDFYICLTCEELDGELLRYLFGYSHTATGNAPRTPPFLPGLPISPATLNAALRPSLAFSARRFGRGKWEPYDPEGDSAEIRDETDWSDDPGDDPEADPAPADLDIR